MSKLGIKDLAPCWGAYKFIFGEDDEKWHIVNVTTYKSKCLLEAYCDAESTQDPVEESEICPDCLRQMREDSEMVEIAMSDEIEEKNPTASRFDYE
jgi:hypothetical protein